METRIFKANDVVMVEVLSDAVEIETVQDALDLMANVDYEGARNVIVYDTIFAPEFFDLKTRIAGDILQKVVMYNMKLAIVGDFDKYDSKSLRAFILECNRGNSIFFVADLDAAIKKIVRPR